jgi:hypothetical protein
MMRIIASIRIDLLAIEDRIVKGVNLWHFQFFLFGGSYLAVS